MLIERLLENLAVDVEPFARCVVSRGWRLRLDGVAWVTFHFVLEGEGTLRSVSGSEHSLHPAVLGVVPAKLDHALDGAGPARREAAAGGPRLAQDGLIEFAAGSRDLGGDDDGDLVVACGRVEVRYGGGLGLFDLLHTPLLLDFGDSSEMCSIFKRLLDEQRSESPGRSAMIQALMRECLVLVFRHLASASEDTLPWLSAVDDPRLAPALDAMLESPERHHTVDSLAADAFMSRTAFSEHFAKRLGRPPMTFLRDVRLRRGADLLRTTDLPVDAVARRVGFSSRSHFSRSFRDYFGIPPIEFRVAEVSGT